MTAHHGASARLQNGGLSCAGAMQLSSGFFGRWLQVLVQGAGARATRGFRGHGQRAAARRAPT